MSGDREKVRLGDLIIIKHGFAFSGEFFKNEESPDALVTPGNFAIGGGFKDDKLRYYAGPVPAEFVLHPGDLLVTMTDLSKNGDTLGYPAIVPSRGDIRFLHNQRIGKVTVGTASRLDKEFLYYLLRSEEYRHEVLSSATGSTVRHTSPSRICAFTFDLPPLREQRAIAEVLGALDDRIDLNRRMNQTMETMAQALFKSWFVDFDPVRAKAEGRHPVGMDAKTAAVFPNRLVPSPKNDGLPEDWSLGPVYRVANVRYGAPFLSSLFNKEGRGLPLLRIRDLATHRPEVFTTERLERATEVLPGDIVVGMDGEFRVHHWHGVRALLNQRVCKFVPVGNIPPVFVSLALVDQLRFFEDTKTGTTVIHLGKADIDTFNVLLPTKPVLDAFGDLTTPLLRKRLANEAECRTLATLRDLLLPKLLSGELRVKDAEAAVAATA